MRVQYIELAGKKYPMVMSLTAIERIEEEFGSLDAMQAALTLDPSSGLTGVIQASEAALGIFLDAGRVYASAIGQEVPPPLTCRITDILDMDAFAAKDLIGGVIASSGQREVEAAPKKAEATPEDTAEPRGSISPEASPE